MPWPRQRYMRLAEGLRQARREVSRTLAPNPESDDSAIPKRDLISDTGVVVSAYSRLRSAFWASVRLRRLARRRGVATGAACWLGASSVGTDVAVAALIVKIGSSLARAAREFSKSRVRGSSTA